jgi:hypothetical protein
MAKIDPNDYNYGAEQYNIPDQDLAMTQTPDELPNEVKAAIMQAQVKAARPKMDMATNMPALAALSAPEAAAPSPEVDPTADYAKALEHARGVEGGNNLLKATNALVGARSLYHGAKTDMSPYNDVLDSINKTEMGKAQDMSSKEKFGQELTQGQLDKQKLEKGKVDLSNEAAKADPNSDVSKLYRQVLKRAGMKDSDIGNASAATLEKAMPGIERMMIAQENRAARWDAKHSAEMAKADANAQKQALLLKDDLDPNKARGGNLAFNQKKVDQAERLEALITDSNGNVSNLDQRQIEELAIGLNSMLTNSSTGAASQVAALVPKSAIGNAKKLQEWLFNEPTGTNQLEFVKRMADTVDREKSTAMHQVQKAQVQRLSAHSGLSKSNPALYNEILQGYGLTPEAMEDVKKGPAKTRSHADEDIMLDPKSGRKVRVDHNTKKVLGWAD